MNMQETQIVAEREGLRQWVSNSAVPQERRHTPRLQFSGIIELHELSTVNRGCKSVSHASIENLSAGGLGICCKTPLVKGSVTQCAIELPGVAIAVPTLMQVMWVSGEKGQYHCGLQYLV